MNIKTTQAQAIAVSLAVRGHEACITVSDDYRSIAVLDANTFAGCLMVYRATLENRNCITPKDAREKASRLKSIAIIESKLE